MYCSKSLALNRALVLSSASTEYCKILVVKNQSHFPCMKLSLSVLKVPLCLVRRVFCCSIKPVPVVLSNDKVSGPVNGDECYFWRTTGCLYGKNCRWKHLPESKGRDRKPWQKSKVWPKKSKIASPQAISHSSRVIFFCGWAPSCFCWTISETFDYKSLHCLIKRKTLENKMYLKNLLQ